MCFCKKSMNHFMYGTVLIFIYGMVPIFSVVDPE
jgi:hypothetical protein